MEIINTGHSEKFLELLNASRKSVTLVSPFIKKSKASQISMSLSSDIKLKILTTFDFSTMLQQASDPEAITVFKENFSNLDIKVKERLHAKVYIFDGEKALITSANLTFSGFESNIEYGVLINEEPHLGLIINDIEMLFSNAIKFEKIAKNQKSLRKQKSYKNRDEDDLVKTIDSVKNAVFNPMERSIPPGSKIVPEKPLINVNQTENIEPIHVAMPLKINFKLGDIIQFHEENDLGLYENYKIIAAKSYKIDKQQRAYKISETRFDEDNLSVINSIEYLLRPGDKIYRCWLSKQRMEWATPAARFKGFIKDGKTAIAEHLNGNMILFDINKGQGPQTIFTIQPINGDEEIELFERQLTYYYKCHI